MKLASKPVNTEILKSAWVLAPTDAQLAASLELIPDGSVFISTIDERSRISCTRCGEHLLVSDLRLDHVQRVITQWLATYPHGRVTLLWPLQESFLAGGIPNLSDDICLEGWVLGDDVARMTFRTSNSKDLDAGVLKLGIALGSGGSDVPIEAKRSVDSIAQHLKRYEALLAEVMQASNSEGLDDTLELLEANHLAPKSNQAEVDELRTKLYEIEIEKSSMQQRYDALAHSSLGKLTLKYWDLRRRSKKKYARKK